MKRWGVVVILSLHMLIPAAASAQNNARDGIAAPPGTILSVLYGYHYFGDYLKADGKTVPMDKVDLQGNYGLWRGFSTSRWDPLWPTPSFSCPSETPAST